MLEDFKSILKDVKDYIFDSSRVLDYILCVTFMGSCLLVFWVWSAPQAIAFAVFGVVMLHIGWRTGKDQSLKFDEKEARDLLEQ